MLKAMKYGLKILHYITHIDIYTLVTSNEMRVKILENDNFF